MELLSPTLADLDDETTTDPDDARYARHPSLPPLPRGTTVIIVLERYIEELEACGDPVQVEAARVLGHVYKGPRVANKLRHT